MLFFFMAWRGWKNCPRKSVFLGWSKRIAHFHYTFSVSLILWMSGNPNTRFLINDKHKGPKHESQDSTKINPLGGILNIDIYDILWYDMQYIWNPNDTCVNWSEKAFFWRFFWKIHHFWYEIHPCTSEKVFGFTSRKRTNDNLKNPPWMKVYFLSNMGIFRCHPC